MDNRKIGIFDSGVGGLTVVREMRELLPGESLVYCGDLARLPYGSKSRENIIAYSREIVGFLLEQDVKAVIIACGTASSNALPTLREEFDLPILGVVEPGARGAARSTRNGKIGVIGTQATVRSGEYKRLLSKINPDIECTAAACPLFVNLVEEGWFDDPVTEIVAGRYLAPLKEQGVDTLVLGCTHYPLLSDVIRREMGEDVALVNPSREVVREMKEFLEKNGMLAEAEEATEEFFVTDKTEQFEELANRILNGDAENRVSVSKIELEA